jgi:perosamine synthetase
LEQFAVPVYADVQYLTGNIDPADIEHRITWKTKAILCIHWAGYPCDMVPLMEIAQRRGLTVIEDAAHALGATYADRPIGTISPFTCFSLQAIKQLTTIDGGLLATLTEEHDDEARVRRWFGIDRDRRRRQSDGYWFWNQTMPGFKYHMNDVSAAVGLGNLEDIGRLLAQRRSQAERYRLELAGVPGVTLFEKREDRESANWLFTMHVERRDAFCRAMLERGVDTSIVHIRNDVHDVFGGRRDDLPTLDRYELTHVSIPIGWWVTEEDQGYVIECIKRGW